MLPLRDNVPTRSFPLVTVGLIAVNFVVWFWELGSRGSRIDHYSYYPCSVSGPCLPPAAGNHLPAWESTFSAMFMHASWVHILGNMLFLWIFGNNVEDALGRVRYLLFYLAAGVVANAGQTFVTLHWAGAAAASIPNLGASGAIAGVLGAYFVLLPRARVLTLIGFFFVPIRAYVFLGVWFLLELYDGGLAVTHPTSGGGTAFFAHVFGFVFGLLLVKPLAVRAPLQPSW
ncbi:MAG: rhomboid family intramembrane serine protease [Actinobacteria bacterium]|nr:rhomboid family intramembrane serine protease [Actinomycetota bacterium]MBV8396224.1 rhomboid family intramembrane serine protease [Actinomycetota bacterium]